MNPSAAAISTLPPAGRRPHLRLAIADAVLGLFPPFTLARIRRWTLWVCGLKTGRATFFWGMPKLAGPGFIASRLKVGAHCGFNDGCVFDLSAPVTIGDHVSVGHEVRFLTSLRQETSDTAAPITVADGVWLGARCTIHGGVTIGAGAVVGAGITVTADVPPNMLVSGAKSVSLSKWR